MKGIYQQRGDSHHDKLIYGGRFVRPDNAMTTAGNEEGIKEGMVNTRFNMGISKIGQAFAKPRPARKFIKMETAGGTEWVRAFINFAPKALTVCDSQEEVIDRFLAWAAEMNGSLGEPRDVCIEIRDTINGVAIGSSILVGCTTTSNGTKDNYGGVFYATVPIDTKQEIQAICTPNTKGV